MTAQVITPNGTSFLLTTVGELLRAQAVVMMLSTPFAHLRDLALILWMVTDAVFAAVSGQVIPTAPPCGMCGAITRVVDTNYLAKDTGQHTGNGVKNTANRSGTSTYDLFGVV